MVSDSDVCTQTIYDFIELSKDGYGIYDKNDTLIYCNPAFAELNYHTKDQLIGKSFQEITRLNFLSGRGSKVDSGNLDVFLQYAQEIRRSRSFRLFEVDYLDGRWFLFSEQMNDNQDLLVQIKEITKQKVLQRGLETSIEKMSELALTDELTGCANRRGFVSSVESELSRCRRTGTSMTMALIDLDFFKKVNDQYGHQIGDAALQHVATLIKKQLRQYDILGRIGGEEFALFLSHTNQINAFHITDRIRNLVADTPLNIQDKSIALSISIGIATQGCNTTFEQLYTESDYALYQAKDMGRNRVQQYTPTL